MDIKESKELSFDTQDFPKEVWVFDADNLDQGTEISHLMMSHAEEYTKDELLVICRKASMVIDQLRTGLAKAQAVPEGFVLVSAEQLSQWGHMANYAEQYGCPECFEARGYAHSLACEINEFFAIEAQEPAND